MSCLGMVVDIPTTPTAPLLASYASARALGNTSRNLSDDMIRTIAQSGGSRSRGGAATINFYSAFLSQPYLDALTATAPEYSRTVLAPKDETAAQGKAHRLGNHSPA
jgi:microsomal dipeptidase-like Zn-dependent dipeptidase